MKQLEWFQSFGKIRRELIFSTLLAIYIILDWVVANAGGFALLAHLVPVLQIHYLLYVASLIYLVYIAILLAANRRFVLAIAYVASLLALGSYFGLVSERVEARSQRDARSALVEMLANPSGSSIVFVDSSLNHTTLAKMAGPNVEIFLESSSFSYHRYKFLVRDSGEEGVYVNVRLGGKKTVFFIEKAARMSPK
jgi:hypothetical protein